jgi:hypothetical protein
LGMSLNVAGKVASSLKQGIWTINFIVIGHLA